jgi:hypothetical protein
MTISPETSFKGWPEHAQRDEMRRCACDPESNSTTLDSWLQPLQDFFVVFRSTGRSGFCLPLRDTYEGMTLIGRLTANSPDANARLHASTKFFARDETGVVSATGVGPFCTSS